jgi:hypothetical protein
MVYEAEKQRGRYLGQTLIGQPIMSITALHTVIRAVVATFRRFELPKRTNLAVSPI